MTMTTEKRFSSIARNYPSFQENNIVKLNAYKWMESRRQDDNAEGLWRVHDTLYDLTDFINKHPGGKDWIKLTKGTDITEAFEVHHLNYSRAANLLQDYRVREAKLPRNFRFTFKETGFYRTLRGRVAEEVKVMNHNGAKFMSKVIIAVLLALTLITAVLSVKFNNRYLIGLSGICMCYTTISAHNFFHHRDNFRMLYFNLAFFNYQEWRIQHAMSHHLFPNSLHDLEITLFEPLLCWFPSPMKSFAQRYASWLYSPFIYMFMCLGHLLRRTIFLVTSNTNLFSLSDLVPLSVPLFMFVFGNSNLFTVFQSWLQIILVNSFLFGFIGLNAGHHHSDNVHEGDKIREDLDWGIYSMDTILDNTDLRKNHLVALTHFGHHALHHLFPTLDHGILPQLYPTLFRTMEEFEVDLAAYHWYHCVYGQFRQLSRTQPNPMDPLEKLRRKRLQKKLE